MMGALERIGAVARALVDRAAFAGESLAVAIALLVFFGFAATRFDLAASAYVWGFFWMRVAEADPVARAPVLGLLGLVLAVLTVLVGCVRWRKASRAFEAFPPSRRAYARMMERLG